MAKTKKSLKECFEDFDEAWQEFDLVIYLALLPWIRKIYKIVSKIKKIKKSKRG